MKVRLYWNNAINVIKKKIKVELLFKKEGKDIVR